MKTYQKICTIIALILMFGGKYFPSVIGLNPYGMATICIFAGTLILLITVSLTWPVLLCLVAFACTGLYTFNGALKDCFGNTVFWFVLLNSIAIGAIEKTGLLKRIALKMICNPIAKKSPWLFIGTFYVALLICGSVMNTTAAVLLFYALMFEILNALNVSKGQRFGVLMLAMIMVIGNISHATTPFGHTITIMSITNFAEVGGFDFGTYAICGYAIGIIGLIVTLLVSKFIFKLDSSKLTDFDADVLLKGLGPVKTEEKIAGGLLAGIIIWWMLPTVIQTPFPTAYEFINSGLGYVTPVAVAMVIMSLVHNSEGKPMLNLTQDIKNAAWASALPTAASMFLGSALQKEEAGVIDCLSTAITPLCQNLSPFIFVAILCLIVFVMTNFTSCTLSLMVGSIVAVALMQAGAISGVHAGAFSVAMAISAQAAYATAPASGPAALYTGYGWSTPGQQMKDGFTYGIFWYILALVGYLAIAAIF